MMDELMGIGAAVLFTAAMTPFYVFYMNGGVEKYVEKFVAYFMTAKEFADDA